MSPARRTQLSLWDPHPRPLPDFPLPQTPPPRAGPRLYLLSAVALIKVNIQVNVRDSEGVRPPRTNPPPLLPSPPHCTLSSRATDN